MSKFFTYYLLALSIIFVSKVNAQCPPATNNLATAYNTNNGQRGAMFDITATNAVTITCFDANLYSGTTANYEIYYKTGSFVGFENNAAAWTFIGGTTGLTSLGNNVPTPIPIPVNVTIPAGQVYSFYITNDFGGGLAYTDGTAANTNLATDANITITGGVGKSYPFGLTFSYRYINATAHYVLYNPIPLVFSNYNPIICYGDSVTVNGSIYYSANPTGIDTLVAGASTGGDSIITTTITELALDSVFEVQTSCNPLDTGLIQTSGVNQDGCDSIYVLRTNYLEPSFETVDILACDSTQVLGTWYSSSVSFNDTLVAGAANGCDSITTFNLTINYADSTFATTTSCNPADTGVVSTLFTNVNSCDSVHTITTTLLPTALEVVDITDCDSVLVLGTWYSSSVSFNDTILAGAANGCDSINTYNITINYADSTFANISSCNPSDTGVIVNTFVNALGCDSVYTEITNLLSVSIANEAVNACDSAWVLGNWYFNNTSIEDTLIGGSINGCDSITIYDITVSNSDSTFSTTNSCNPADTGYLSTTYTNVNNCDSIHTVYTGYLQTSYANSNLVGCDSIWAAGSWYYNSIVFNDTIIGGASNGCDSITTFNVTINYSDSTFATATSCNPADTGVVSTSFTNTLSCDSVHTVTTTLLPTAFEVVDITDCDSALVLGNWYSSSTSFNDTLIGGSVNGCDSVTIYQISINYSDSTFATVTSCNPADTGVVSTLFTNAASCDSVHTVTTNLLPTAFEVINIADCDSTPVLGTWYSSSISFNDTIIAGAANGCDSITTFNVTINYSDSTFASATSCNPADTGVVSTTFTNLSSCDSVHTVTTTLSPFSSVNINVVDCDSTLIDGNWYYNSTTYEDTIVGGAANGCDSITVYQININYSDSTFATATSCNPADTGVVSTTFTNATSCDSVHTVTTNLLPTAFEVIDITDCDSTQVLGTWYASSISFNDTIVAGAANGCDSITTFNVTINYSDSTFATATSCNPADTGVVSTTFTNASSCDSVHTVSTTLLPTAFEVVDITDCDSTQVLSTWYSSSISFNDTIVAGAANGCDSITTFNLTINYSDATFASLTSCNPADTGVVSSTFTNASSCDSVHTVTTTLLPTAFEVVDITDCDSTQVLGTWYSSSISFNDTIVAGAANGCDSITTFNLSINYSDSTFELTGSCNPVDTGIVTNNFLNQAGCDSTHTIQTNLLRSDSTFTFTTSCNPADTGITTVLNTNELGCDSLHTTITNLINSTSSFNQISACEQYTWIDGITYFNDTTLVDTLTGSNTCDSIATTQINILSSSSSTIPLLVCPNDLPVILDNGIVIDGSQNTVNDTISNAVNCDSIITYDITYAPSYDVDPDYIIANLGDSVSFIINGSNNDIVFSYNSNNGSECEAPCNDYILIPSQEFNNYYFSIIDTSTNCIFNDTIIIESKLFSELNVPNIFTPNNDGSNDIYRCYGENIDQYSLEIFDRSGGKIFESNSINFGWDGLFQGQAVESGMYIVVIQATGLDGQKYSISQNIKLVR